MPGKILIVDPVATNRIVLKVKLTAVSYRVVQAATGGEALNSIETERPDLILCADDLSDMNAASFAHKLRSDPDTKSIPIVVIPPENLPASRLDLLQAGADEVLPRPLIDGLLLARLRSLLRLRETSEELTLREGASRALGLCETPEIYVTPAKIALVAATPDIALKWAHRIETHTTGRVTGYSNRQALRHLLGQDTLDAVILVLCDESMDAGLQLLADLRSKPETRDCCVFALIENKTEALATADLLNRGADDAMGHTTALREIALRLERQIQRKRRLEQLRLDMQKGLRAALTDPLTGLNNRRYAMPRLANIAEAAKQEDKAFAAMVIDVDHFKSINDRYGHAAGDAVLIRIGEVLKKALPEDGFLARIGGEEFLVVLPQAMRSTAQHVAEDLCAKVAHTRFVISDRLQPIDVTVSVGVAVSNELGLTSNRKPLHERVLERADQALYLAKSHGRNKVVFSSERSAA